MGGSVGGDAGWWLEGGGGGELKREYGTLRATCGALRTTDGCTVHFASA